MHACAETKSQRAVFFIDEWMYLFFFVFFCNRLIKMWTFQKEKLCSVKTNRSLGLKSPEVGLTESQGDGVSCIRGSVVGICTQQDVVSRLHASSHKWGSIVFVFCFFLIPCSFQLQMQAYVLGKLHKKGRIDNLTWLSWVRSFEWIVI